MPTGQQIPLDFDYRPAMSGQDFLVSDCNQEAVAWLDKWPDWPSPFLLICGDAGCGKTHLAEVFHQASAAPFISLETDPYAMVGQSKAVIVEDVDQLVYAHQQDLFHLFNHARENRIQVLLTARTLPQKWALDLPDLKSRLGTMPIAEIGHPDDAVMQAVLVKLFADRQLNVTMDVVQYMLARMERSFDQARALVSAIDGAALAQKRRITVPLVREVLQASQ